MAIGIDPAYKTSEKHEYGASLVRGLFAFFLELGQRGIEIETITARSHKPDGLRLLRKIGIPQLHSPVSGKALFALRVSESGFYIFERYSELLTEWRVRHTAPTLPSSPYAHGRRENTQPRAPTSLGAYTSTPVEAPQKESKYPGMIVVPTRPANTITSADLTTRMGITRSTLYDYLSKGYAHYGVKKGIRNEYERYYTPEQAQEIMNAQASSKRGGGD